MNEVIDYGLHCSYKDVPWLVKSLLTKTPPRTTILEEEFGYYLIIPDRDWLMGGTTMSLIIQSIQQSKRAIFLVSRCAGCTFKLISFIVHFISPKIDM